MKEVHIVLDGEFGHYSRFDFGNFGVDVKPETDEKGTQLIFIPFVSPERYSSFHEVEKRIEDIFFKCYVEDDLVSKVREIATGVEDNQYSMDNLGMFFCENLRKFLDGSERYIPDRDYANTQERLNAFLETVRNDSQMYSSERNMRPEKVERHLKWLSKLEKAMSNISTSLSEEELSKLLDIAESIYPRNFYSGTGYGTCYGARQLLHIINNVQSQLSSPQGDVRIPYMMALRDLYEIRASIYVIPLDSLLEHETDGQFPVHTIPFMNKKLKSAKSSNEQIKIIQEVMREAQEHYVSDNKK